MPQGFASLLVIVAPASLPTLRCIRLFAFHSDSPNPPDTAIVGRVMMVPFNCSYRRSSLLSWRKSDFPSDDAAFERCRVKSHEDFPRHIYLLFLVLGIQFRWVLTRGPLARALVSQADLAINDIKEHAWMTLYEHDRDTLEDILYQRLQDLWAPLTDAMKVFDTHGSVTLLSSCVPRRYGKPFLLPSRLTTNACSPRNRPHDALGWRLQGRCQQSFRLCH